MDTTTPASTRSPNRRALLKGAVWAAPAVAAGIAAPAYAASFECAPQTAAQIQSSFAFKPGTNNAIIENWTQTRSAGAPQVRFASNANNLANAAFLQDDPSTASATTTTLLSPAVCLGPGTYAFAFDSSLYHANARNAELTASVLDAATSAVLGNTITFKTTTGSQTLRTGDVITVRVAQRTQIQFRYRWVVDSGGTTGTARYGDDIAVTAPRVAKTA